MSYFTEESTLGILIENPRTEEGGHLLDKNYVIEYKGIGSVAFKEKYKEYKLY